MSLTHCDLCGMEWKHHGTACSGGGSVKQIHSDRGQMKHSDEISFFNRLIIDLKLKLLGKDPTEDITMERLNEGTQHVGKLMECREKMLWKRR